MSGFIPPLVPSDETLREVNELTSKLLPIPEGAYRKGEQWVKGEANPAFTASWKEDLEIVGSQIKADTKVPGRYIVNLRTKPLRMDASGKTFWMSYYLDPEELRRVGKAPEAKAKAAKMTQMSSGKLNEILRALGVEAHGKGVDYTQYFHSENGAEPPVVGQKVTAAIYHKWSERMGDWQQEADAGKGRVTFTKCEGVI